jgi:hypothetical protein
MGSMRWFDRSQLWLGILSFVMFSLGSGIIAGYVAGRLDELRRYAVSTAVLGLSSFFLVLVMYMVYLRLYARMPAAWTGPLLWGLYPGMVAAVILGWYVAKQRKASSTKRTNGK